MCNTLERSRFCGEIEKKTPDLTFEVLKNFTKDFFKVKFRIPHASLTRRAVPSLNLPPTRLIYLTKSRRQV